MNIRRKKTGCELHEDKKAFDVMCKNYTFLVKTRSGN